MFLILVGDWQRDMRVPCPLPKYNNLVKYIFINYTYDLLQGIKLCMCLRIQIYLVYHI